MLVCCFLQCLSVLPLPFLHLMGGLLGRLVYQFDSRFQERTRTNATQAGFNASVLWRESAAHMGRGVLELAHLWTWRVEGILSRVKVIGWDEVLKAKAKGHGVLIATPHLGCFEVLSLWIGKQTSLSAMYRPPKLSLIAKAMLMGRQKFNVRMASADVKGIRIMLRALKNGELVGILPDQVPSEGDFTLANVFSAPALTMTLPAKLLKQTGAVMVIAYAKRVTDKHRYELYFKVVDFKVTGDASIDATHINDLMAELIMTAPEQYLWAYNRYKGVDDLMQKMKLKELSN